MTDGHFKHSLIYIVQTADRLRLNDTTTKARKQYESEKTYSATDIADMFGVSAQKIGKIANANGMKTSEYGKFYKDKSRYSNKEVDTFRYNEKAIEKFKEILS